MPRQPAPRKKQSTAKSTATSTSTSPQKSSPKDDAKRLNQVLASAGLGSRRHCEDLIREGRVQVDGEVITKLAVTVNLTQQKVRVDGLTLKPQKLVYYAVHKPTGVVSTNSDPQGRVRVIDLVPPTERVYPVGRLDRTSDGLILLTNDGELAQSLAHPKFGIQKVYRVTVAGEVRPETMRKMREGIYIAEGLVRVDGAKVLKARKKATDMEIRLREGKNREIRRILAKFGHKVQTLRRIAIGPLKLGEMPAGAYRKLTREEIEKLRSIAAQATAAPPAKPTAEEAAGRGGSDGRGPGVGKPRDLKPKPKPKSRAGKGGNIATRTAGPRPRTADGKIQPRTNRRPVKTDKQTTPTPDRDAIRVGKIIVGDEVVSEPPDPKKKRAAAKKTSSASRARTGGRGKSASRNSSRNSSDSRGRGTEKKSSQRSDGTNRKRKGNR